MCLKYAHAKFGMCVLGGIGVALGVFRIGLGSAKGAFESRMCCPWNAFGLSLRCVSGVRVECHAWGAFELRLGCI